jgi:hypothetical protein
VNDFSKEKIEEMMIFTKELCRKKQPENQYQIAARNCSIIKDIVEKFELSNEDAEFVFKNNYDFKGVYDYFNQSENK